MRVLLQRIHTIGVILVIATCVYEVWRAYSYYSIEDLAFTSSRIVPAILCGTYAVAHIFLLIKHRVTIQALLWFYPLSIVLGLMSGFVVRAYGKGWAPANPFEAARATIMCFGFVAFIWLMAAFSVYRSWYAKNCKKA